MDKELESQSDKDLIEIKYLQDKLTKLKKMENKKWQSTEKDATLDYNLSKITKEELLYIAKNLYINKVSKLNKEDLKNHIIELYEDRVIMLIENMDKPRFEYLLDLAKYDGYKEYDNIIDVNIDTAYYLADRAFIFTGIIKDKHVVMMPKELQRIILSYDNKEFRAEMKKNEEIIKLFWGMCYHYGVLLIDDFKEIVKKYIDYDISEVPLEIMLIDAAIYYGEFDCNGYIGADITVENPSYILEEQEDRKDLDFYNFTKKEILDVATLGNISESKAHKNLKKFLIENFDMDKEDAEDLIFDLLVDVQNGKSPSKYILEFLKSFDTEDIELINMVTSEITKFANSTKQWLIKGYSPNELRMSMEDTQKVEKIGRNDPCPCGSGKKYKKCCASNIIEIGDR
ncbi:SEC-C metal-binding domain-containing protein [Clostridium algidicarnis]|uniref:SEC-C metal-binding domain-containing protein n=1 Tax=Clostridium algidicarnis TaxID=37659 RepID=UPI001C0BE9C6|nr:SEC-C metal-binding domain-containing protein [Clostridium algidicarnis]MBU3227275.1 SEC-C domain-containing protein [Clostridium algidicarnis]MBU3250799.1 SEC-C domain-containing protein [Clostridium algidicarnis]